MISPLDTNRKRDFKIVFSLLRSKPSNRGKFVMLSLLVGGIGCFLYMRHKQEWFSFWIRFSYTHLRPADGPITSEQLWFSLYIQGWWPAIFRLRIYHKRSSTVEHVRFIGPDEFDGKLAIQPFLSNVNGKRQKIIIKQFLQRTRRTSTTVESKFKINLQDRFEMIEIFVLFEWKISHEIIFQGFNFLTFEKIWIASIHVTSLKTLNAKIPRYINYDSVMKYTRVWNQLNDYFIKTFLEKLKRGNAQFFFTVY